MDADKNQRKSRYDQPVGRQYVRLKSATPQMAIFNAQPAIRTKVARSEGRANRFVWSPHNFGIEPSPLHCKNTNGSPNLVEYMPDNGHKVTRLFADIREICPRIKHQENDPFFFNDDFVWPNVRQFVSTGFYADMIDDVRNVDYVRHDIGRDPLTYPRNYEGRKPWELSEMEFYYQEEHRVNTTFFVAPKIFYQENFRKFVNWGLPDPMFFFEERASIDEQKERLLEAFRHTRQRYLKHIPEIRRNTGAMAIIFKEEIDEPPVNLLFVCHHLRIHLAGFLRFFKTQNNVICAVNTVNFSFISFFVLPNEIIPRWNKEEKYLFHYVTMKTYHDLQNISNPDHISTPLSHFCQQANPKRKSEMKRTGKLVSQSDTDCSAYFVAYGKLNTTASLDDAYDDGNYIMDCYRNPSKRKAERSQGNNSVLDDHPSTSKDVNIGTMMRSSTYQLNGEIGTQFIPIRKHVTNRFPQQQPSTSRQNGIYEDIHLSEDDEVEIPFSSEEPTTSQGSLSSTSHNTRLSDGTEQNLIPIGAYCPNSDGPMPNVPTIRRQDIQRVGRKYGQSSASIEAEKRWREFGAKFVVNRSATIPMPGENVNTPQALNEIENIVVDRGSRQEKRFIDTLQDQSILKEFVKDPKQWYLKPGIGDPTEQAAGQGTNSTNGSVEEVAESSTEKLPTAISRTKMPSPKSKMPLLQQEKLIQREIPNLENTFRVPTTPPKKYNYVPWKPGTPIPIHKRPDITHRSVSLPRTFVASPIKKYHIRHPDELRTGLPTFPTTSHQQCSTSTEMHSAKRASPASPVNGVPGPSTAKSCYFDDTFNNNINEQAKNEVVIQVKTTTTAILCERTPSEDDGSFKQLGPKRRGRVVKRKAGRPKKEDERPKGPEITATSDSRKQNVIRNTKSSARAKEAAVELEAAKAEKIAQGLPVYDVIGRAPKQDKPPKEEFRRIWEIMLDPHIMDVLGVKYPPGVEPVAFPGRPESLAYSRGARAARDLTKIRAIYQIRTGCPIEGFDRLDPEEAKSQNQRAVAKGFLLTLIRKKGPKKRNTNFPRPPAMTKLKKRRITVEQKEQIKIRREEIVARYKLDGIERRIRKKDGRLRRRKGAGSVLMIPKHRDQKRKTGDKKDEQEGVIETRIERKTRKAREAVVRRVERKEREAREAEVRRIEDDARAAVEDMLERIAPKPQIETYQKPVSNILLNIEVEEHQAILAENLHVEILDSLPTPAKLIETDSVNEETKEIRITSEKAQQLASELLVTSELQIKTSDLLQPHHLVHVNREIAVFRVDVVPQDELENVLQTIADKTPKDLEFENPIIDLKEINYQKIFPSITDQEDVHQIQEESSQEIEEILVTLIEEIVNECEKADSFVEQEEEDSGDLKIAALETLKKNVKDLYITMHDEFPCSNSVMGNEVTPQTWIAAPQLTNLEKETIPRDNEEFDNMEGEDQTQFIQNKEIEREASYTLAIVPYTEAPYLKCLKGIMASESVSSSFIEEKKPATFEEVVVVHEADSIHGDAFNQEEEQEISMVFENEMIMEVDESVVLTQQKSAEEQTSVILEDRLSMKQIETVSLIVVEEEFTIEEPYVEKEIPQRFEESAALLTKEKLYEDRQITEQQAVILKSLAIVPYTEAPYLKFLKRIMASESVSSSSIEDKKPATLEEVVVVHEADSIHGDVFNQEEEQEISMVLHKKVIIKEASNDQSMENIIPVVLDIMEQLHRDIELNMQLVQELPTLKETSSRTVTEPAMQAVQELLVKEASVVSEAGTIFEIIQATPSSVVDQEDFSELHIVKENPQRVVAALVEDSETSTTDSEMEEELFSTFENIGENEEEERYDEPIPTSYTMYLQSVTMKPVISSSMEEETPKTSTETVKSQEIEEIQDVFSIAVNQQKVTVTQEPIDREMTKVFDEPVATHEIAFIEDVSSIKPEVIVPEPLVVENDKISADSSTSFIALANTDEMLKKIPFMDDMVISEERDDKSQTTIEKAPQERNSSYTYNKSTFELEEATETIQAVNASGVVILYTADELDFTPMTACINRPQEEEEEVHVDIKVDVTANEGLIQLQREQVNQEYINEEEDNFDDPASTEEEQRTIPDNIMERAQEQSTQSDGEENIDKDEDLLMFIHESMILSPELQRSNSSRSISALLEEPDTSENYQASGEAKKITVGKEITNKEIPNKAIEQSSCSSDFPVSHTSPEEEAIDLSRQTLTEATIKQGGKSELAPFLQETVESRSIQQEQVAAIDYEKVIIARHDENKGASDQWIEDNDTDVWMNRRETNHGGPEQYVKDSTTLNKLGTFANQWESRRNQGFSDSNFEMRLLPNDRLLNENPLRFSDNRLPWQQRPTNMTQNFHPIQQQPMVQPDYMRRSQPVPQPAWSGYSSTSWNLPHLPQHMSSFSYSSQQPNGPFQASSSLMQPPTSKTYSMAQQPSMYTTSQPVPNPYRDCPTMRGYHPHMQPTPSMPLQQNPGEQIYGIHQFLPFQHPASFQQQPSQIPTVQQKLLQSVPQVPAQQQHSQIALQRHPQLHQQLAVQSAVPVQPVRQPEISTPTIAELALPAPVVPVVDPVVQALPTTLSPNVPACSIPTNMKNIIDNIVDEVRQEDILARRVPPTTSALQQALATPIVVRENLQPTDKSRINNFTVDNYLKEANLMKKIKPNGKKKRFRNSGIRVFDENSMKKANEKCDIIPNSFATGQIGTQEALFKMIAKAVLYLFDQLKKKNGEIDRFLPPDFHIQVIRHMIDPLNYRDGTNVSIQAYRLNVTDFRDEVKVLLSKVTTEEATNNELNVDPSALKHWNLIKNICGLAKAESIETSFCLGELRHYVKNIPPANSSIRSIQTLKEYLIMLLRVIPDSKPEDDVVEVAAEQFILFNCTVEREGHAIGTHTFFAIFEKIIQGNQARETIKFGPFYPITVGKNPVEEIKFNGQPTGVGVEAINRDVSIMYYKGLDNSDTRTYATFLCRPQYSQNFVRPRKTTGEHECQSSTSVFEPVVQTADEDQVIDEHILGDSVRIEAQPMEESIAHFVGERVSPQPMNIDQPITEETHTSTAIHPKILMEELSSQPLVEIGVESFVAEPVIQLNNFYISQSEKESIAPAPVKKTAALIVETSPQYKEQEKKVVSQAQVEQQNVKNVDISEKSEEPKKVRVVNHKVPRKLSKRRRSEMKLSSFNEYYLEKVIHLFGPNSSFVPRENIIISQRQGWEYITLSHIYRCDDLLRHMRFKMQKLEGFTQKMKASTDRIFHPFIDSLFLELNIARGLITHGAALYMNRYMLTPSNILGMFMGRSMKIYSINGLFDKYRAFIDTLFSESKLIESVEKIKKHVNEKLPIMGIATVNFARGLVHERAYNTINQMVVPERLLKYTNFKMPRTLQRDYPEHYKKIAEIKALPTSDDPEARAQEMKERTDQINEILRVVYTPAWYYHKRSNMKATAIENVVTSQKGWWKIFDTKFFAATETKERISLIANYVAKGVAGNWVRRKFIPSYNLDTQRRIRKYEQEIIEELQQQSKQCLRQTRLEGIESLPDHIAAAKIIYHFYSTSMLVQANSIDRTLHIIYEANKLVKNVKECAVTEPDGQFIFQYNKRAFGPVWVNIPSSPEGRSIDDGDDMSGDGDTPDGGQGGEGPKSNSQPSKRKNLDGPEDFGAPKSKMFPRPNGSLDTEENDYSLLTGKTLRFDDQFDDRLSSSSGFGSCPSIRDLDDDFDSIVSNDTGFASLLPDVANDNDGKFLMLEETVVEEFDRVEPATEEIVIEEIVEDKPCVEKTIVIQENSTVDGIIYKEPTPEKIIQELVEKIVHENSTIENLVQNVDGDHKKSIPEVDVAVMSPPRATALIYEKQLLDIAISQKGKLNLSPTSTEEVFRAFSENLPITSEKTSTPLTSPSCFNDIFNRRKSQTDIEGNKKSATMLDTLVKILQFNKPSEGLPSGSDDLEVVDILRKMSDGNSHTAKQPTPNLKPLTVNTMPTKRKFSPMVTPQSASTPSTPALTPIPEDGVLPRKAPSHEHHFFFKRRYKITKDWFNRTVTIEKSKRIGRGQKTEKEPTPEAKIVHHLFRSGKTTLPLVLKGAKLDFKDMEVQWDRKVRHRELHKLREAAKLLPRVSLTEATAASYNRVIPPDCQPSTSKDISMVHDLEDEVNNPMSELANEKWDSVLSPSSFDLTKLMTKTEEISPLISPTRGVISSSYRPSTSKQRKLSELTNPSSGYYIQEMRRPSSLSSSPFREFPSFSSSSPLTSPTKRLIVTKAALKELPPPKLFYEPPAKKIALSRSISSEDDVPMFVRKQMKEIRKEVGEPLTIDTTELQFNNDFDDDNKLMIVTDEEDVQKERLSPKLSFQNLLQPLPDITGVEMSTVDLLVNRLPYDSCSSSQTASTTGEDTLTQSKKIVTRRKIVKGRRFFNVKCVVVDSLLSPPCSLDGSSLVNKKMFTGTWLHAECSDDYTCRNGVVDNFEFPDPLIQSASGNSKKQPDV